MSRLPINPKTWGPGAWLSIHVTALDVTSSNDIPYFIKFLNNLTKKLPCHKCREHATQYIEQNPPEKYITSPSMAFRYTVDLHNNANKITGRDTIDYDTAMRIYRELDNIHLLMTHDCVDNEIGCIDVPEKNPDMLEKPIKIITKPTNINDIITFSIPPTTVKKESSYKKLKR